MTIEEIDARLAADREAAGPEAIRNNLAAFPPGMRLVLGWWPWRGSARGATAGPRSDERRDRPPLL